MIEEEELTGQIIQVFYKVYNTLGYGFIESIYHNAMIIELSAAGLNVETEKPIAVLYRGLITMISSWGLFQRTLSLKAK